jgi:carboxymethylenebutenolidase
MSSTRGTTLTPILSGLACIAMITGGVLFGRQHPATHLDAVTTHGEWVKFPNAKGDSVRAYVAYPERKDRAPAIIVIHEIFGMTDWEPTVADKFAAKGFVAIAPDLLSSRYGMSPPTPDSGRKLVATLTDAGVIADLDAVYKWVNAQPATQGGNTGVIGFCWGGGTVWKYAAANPDVKAAVPCYGPVSDTANVHGIKATVYGVYAEKDARVNGNLADVTTALTNGHTAFTSKIYPGMAHGFLKPGRDGADSPTADQARADIDAFFAKQLGRK